MSERTTTPCRQGLPARTRQWRVKLGWEDLAAGLLPARLVMRLAESYRFTDRVGLWPPLVAVAFAMDRAAPLDAGSRR